MFEPRPKEPDYAFLPDAAHPENNCHGLPIETVPDGHALRDQSLNINGDSAIGDNPNRYKQHGFYFTADNCIACHACEAACSEKNDLPAHIAFRSVGYVEGGSYPDYTRLNISMACNHCDDPVCLKGCPTLAYTKFAEYGAVLQDPDICFGCGYCTWVCPYNAPQLDDAAGHVSKCNMCVDRLEVGLKPTCVSACLAGALDFGVIETTPEQRQQVATQIPGFPDPEITQPNIRFEQTQSLPASMSRPDSMPLVYQKPSSNKTNTKHQTTVKTENFEKKWSLKKLRTREDPLVVFTLLSQLVIGAFAVMFASDTFNLGLISNSSHPVLYPSLLFALLGIETFALVLSTMHLGRPHRFYRAFNNLRNSPVSREVASLAVFYNLLGATAVVAIWPESMFGISADSIASIGWLLAPATCISGIVALYFMHTIYRIKARPFWNHWQVLSSFYGSMLTLGSLFVGLILACSNWLSGHSYSAIFEVLALPITLGLLLESIGLLFHARDMKRSGGEGEASLHKQTTEFSKTYRLRNYGLVLSLMAVLILSLVSPSGLVGLTLWLLLTLIVAVAAIIGRALFFALVISTTMPGAFFWRNQGFVDHARETGLAKMSQVGVLADKH